MIRRCEIMKANRTITRENAMRVLYQIFLYKKNHKKQLKTVLALYKKTGVAGIEPAAKVLETPMIPFHHTPINKY